MGDVIEIPTSNGLAYAQITHKVPSYGSLIRVLPGLFEVRPSRLDDITVLTERFYIFFPAGAAVHRGLVAVIGNVPVPTRAQPFPLLRQRGYIEPGGKVRDWWLWDGTNSWRVGQLTTEQRALSLGEIWNDTLLIERILDGWKPQDAV